MSELRALHQQLIEMLDQLGELTLQSAPDEAALAALRYRLTRASGARRRLVNTLCLELQLALPEDELAAVRAVRASSIAAMASSSDHIGAWTLRQLVKDWPGYCSASQLMRRAMREQIDAEKAALYPHL